MTSSLDQQWTEIAVEADLAAVDDVVNLLNRHCTGGAVVEELAPPLYGAGGTLLTEEGATRPARVTVKGFLPTWDAETLRKLEIALLLLARTGAISEPRIRVLADKDWAEAWKAFFPPLPIGQRLVIVPTWVEYTPQAHEIILRLDPGMAFGTGLHASTRLCLVALERFLVPGARVLDVGTGSGILAIAAALLGAYEVQAIDNDPVAVRVAAENAALNGVEGCVRTAWGTLAGLGPSPVPVFAGNGFDLLLINILAEVIIPLAPAIAAALRLGGHCIASGILGEKGDSVAEALTRAGLTVEERLFEEGWVALIGRKG